MFILKIYVFFVFITNRDKEIHHMGIHCRLGLGLVVMMIGGLGMCLSDLFGIIVRML
jgi:hypothetical protein